MTEVKPEDALRFYSELKVSYAYAFSEVGQAALWDLARFCRAGETLVAALDRTAPIDVHRTFILIGRHDVHVRIKQFLERTPEELVAINTRPAKGAISHARSDASDPTA